MACESSKSRQRSRGVAWMSYESVGPGGDQSMVLANAELESEHLAQCIVAALPGDGANDGTHPCNQV
jgi:hypothetical protein